MLWVPQRNLAIAACPGECDALADQPLAEPLSAPGRVDQQQPQLCDLVAVPDQKYRADLHAIDLGDPAAFARGVERGQEFSRDIRHQGFERRVKTIFAGIERAVALHHPSNVARPGLAQYR